MRPLALLLCTMALATAGSLPQTAPAPQGISPASLQQLHSFMEDMIDRGAYLGAVTLVARNGAIVDHRGFGHLDLARTAAMPPDAIFRIYSMTKPVTSVAVLMLMEQGRLALDDPIARYLPEFADMRVLVAGSAEAPELRAARRPITVRHLLTHTAGLAAGAPAGSALGTLLDRADLDAAPDLASYVARLARVPLAADPGERFNYDGASTEPLARLVEVVSVMAFDTFLARRIFEPLRLDDTGFSVPPEKRPRIAELTSTNEQGRLMRAPVPAAARPGDMMKAYPSGAGGLYSTAADYARFCQMLLNGGELEGVSILRRETVELMMMDHLRDLPADRRGGVDGFGLGGYVTADGPRRARPGSAGLFGWLGAASTYFTIDRKERLVTILMMQHLPQGLPRDPPKIDARFQTLVYQALVN